MIPVTAPPRVHALLRDCPDGPLPVVHRGRDAVYLRLGEQCAGVLGRAATLVPCALRTQLDHLDVSTAHVRDGVLHLDGVPLVVGRLVDVSVPRLAGIVASSGTPAVPPGEPAHTIGRGEGLTPYADDVWCGWLAVHRAAGVRTPEIDAAVRACLHRTTLLSATLLDCALRGEVVPEFAAYVRALGTVDRAERARALTSVGHTSGHGLLHGADLALAGLRPADLCPAQHRTGAAA